MTEPADRRAYDVQTEVQSILAAAQARQLPDAQRIAALESHVAVLTDQVRQLTFDVKRLRQQLARGGKGGEPA